MQLKDIPTTVQRQITLPGQVDDLMSQLTMTFLKIRIISESGFKVWVVK